MAIKNKLADLISRSKGAVEGLNSELEANRSKRIEQTLEREKIATAPISETEIRKRVEGVLDDAERSVFKGFDFIWLYDPNNGLADRVAEQFERRPLGALSAFGLRRLVSDALVSQTLAAIPTDQVPLSVDEREKRLAKLDADLEALALDEERMVRGMEAAGIAVHRRADADPAIFLRRDL